MSYCVRDSLCPWLSLVLIHCGLVSSSSYFTVPIVSLCSCFTLSIFFTAPKFHAFLSHCFTRCFYLIPVSLSPFSQCPCFTLSMFYYVHLITMSTSWCPGFSLSVFHKIFFFRLVPTAMCHRVFMFEYVYFSPCSCFIMPMFDCAHISLCACFVELLAV